MSDEELRAHPRYVASPPIEAEFENVVITLVNISVRGALIRHEDPIDGMKSGVLKFGGGGMALHAEVIWTRTRTVGEGGTFESGLMFTQWIEVAQGVIDRLTKADWIHLDASRPPSIHRGGVL
jgi:hypothetical protein